MIELTINGESRHFSNGNTLADLLQELEINQQHVAVEVNTQIVPRESHTQHLLRSGDNVEIVTLVGGG